MGCQKARCLLAESSHQWSSDKDITHKINESCVDGRDNHFTGQILKYQRSRKGSGYGPLMYHKDPFHASVGSTSGQRWSDTLCHLGGIKGTLWVKGSQLLRCLESGRLLVWNLNTNPDSKTKLFPAPLAQERLTQVFRGHGVGGLPQGQADRVLIATVIGSQDSKCLC